MDFKVDMVKISSRTWLFNTSAVLCNSHRKLPDRGRGIFALLTSKKVKKAKAGEGMTACSCSNVSKNVKLAISSTIHDIE